LLALNSSDNICVGTNNVLLLKTAETLLEVIAGWNLSIDFGKKTCSDDEK